jgi:hypothetical protein
MMQKPELVWQALQACGQILPEEAVEIRVENGILIAAHCLCKGCMPPKAVDNDDDNGEGAGGMGDGAGDGAGGGAEEDAESGGESPRDAEAGDEEGGERLRHSTQRRGVQGLPHVPPRVRSRKSLWPNARAQICQSARKRRL